jgi:hypothetical protein
VAALIEQDVHVTPELVEGGRGEFTVWVGDERVAQKDAGGFPQEPDVVSAVRRALERA